MDYLTNPSARRYQRYQKQGNDTQALQGFRSVIKKSPFSGKTDEHFLLGLMKITRGAARHCAERHNTAQEEPLNV